MPSNVRKPVETELTLGDLEAKALACFAFLAGAGALFTFPLVGALPFSEVPLLLLFGFIFFQALRQKEMPHPLLRSRTFKHLLIAVALSLAGYILTDLVRVTPATDAARGWARWVFLAIDITAVTYLFAKGWSNLRWYVWGLCAGVLLAMLTRGTVDYWKYGFAYPLSFSLPLLVSSRRPFLLSVLLVALGVLHVVLGARSLGGICLLAGAVIWMSSVSVKKRLVGLAFCVPAALALIVYVYQSSGVGERAEGSTTERTAMVQFAGESFLDSPFIGQGSWFTKGRRVDAFFARRAELRGGVDEVNLLTEDEVVVHSQILVALAEGGFFGGAFFLLLAGLLGWGVWFAATRDFTMRPVVLVLLLNGSWDLLMSPFSGAERVFIACSCAILIALRAAGRAR